MLATEIQNLNKNIWLGLVNSINSQFGSKTNPYQKRNNIPDLIIPIEGNPSNKMKDTHCQVKCMSECYILQWNHIYPLPYIHPCSQVISLNVIEILHRIGWFARRNKKWVIVTLDGYFPQTLSLQQTPSQERSRATSTS